MFRPRADNRRAEYVVEAGAVDQSEKPSRELLFVGLFAIALGAFVMLMVSGVIPSKDGAMHAPLWVVVCAGSVFILAGAALLLRHLGGGSVNDGEMPAGAPFWLHVAQYIIGLIVIGALASVGTWIAFGPGPRAFSVTIPFLGSGPGNGWMGRIVFGAGTILTWLCFAIMAVLWGRKLWRRGRAGVPHPR
jgi:hypothetical protein